MKRLLTILAATGCSAMLNAQEATLSAYRYSGPSQLTMPLMVDSVDVNSKKFDVSSLLGTHLSFESVKDADVRTDMVLPGCESAHALHLVGFTLKNSEYTFANISVKGLKEYQLFVDGVKQSGRGIVLEPANHDVVIKYLSSPDSTDTLKVTAEATNGKTLVLGTDAANRTYTIYDVLHARRCTDVRVSPSGKYMIVRYSQTRPGGASASYMEIRDAITGKFMERRTGSATWMPASDKFYFVRTNAEGVQSLVTVEPATRVETVMADNIPNGNFIMSPDEKTLFYTLTQEGPKERKEIFEVIEPDDRQPGWRNRSKIAKYDLATGLMQPLTHGYHSVYVSDISSDSRYLLLMKSESRLTKRPTTLSTVYRLDLTTMQTDTLVKGDGFISSASFSPDGKEVLISGSPESLGGIGKNVEAGQTPSMVDKQLFIMDIASRKVRPVTKDFNPCVQNEEWCRHDGMIYFNAEDKDCVNLFRMNPKNGEIKRIQLPEEMINRFSLANAGATIAFYGQSASNSDRVYTMNTKKLKPILVEDISNETLSDITLGECKAWNYINAKGDTICCRYYLPPHYDGKTPLPMIVNYYGGCSPTSRNFESRYPHHAYSALGYAVLVINPSGATGFGQKFSARHVNTAGEGVAEDIIGATRQFCKEHPFINDKKIGCIGASYGGFMTMYLQTRTDLFAAAISHAGISDHTSYWGEGYWGYSYSEVSMANSYPWADKKLFVDQSPLFNADKVTTPILFLHGEADNNVPVGESIQMYTALKLLGRETAMVLVPGQDHHITDYTKRLLWQNTIYAWFAKWLKDDASWWNDVYKPKDL